MKGFKLIHDFGIRAWLGTLVVAPGMGALAYLALKGSSEALIALSTNITAVLGFYFLTRKEQTPSP